MTKLDSKGRILTASLVLAVSFSGWANAQASRSMSLAERVAVLERQMGSGASVEPAQSNVMVDMLNRIDQLQREVQELRAVVEQQQFELEASQRRQRDQYLDLDQRLSSVGGGATGQSSAFTSSPTRPVQSDVAPLAEQTASPQTTPDNAVVSSQLPEVRPPVEADLQTSAIDASVAPAAVAFVDPAQEKAAYDAAFNELKNGRYASAARSFSAFVQSYPDSEFSDNAQYWLGEAYYVTGNYRIALESFQNLLNRYPDSTKVADALLKIGYAQYELKEWAAAEHALTDVVETYPGTTVARLAEGRLRAMRLEGHIQ
ncbi:MAG: tol-pal system protein YbgF [Lysobacteraceae bacterium]|nr:MAG: tol-pal system protein YbgF [Xanthomonadaceae bacterium]